MEEMKETAPTEAIGCIIDSGQEAKTQILSENAGPPGGCGRGRGRRLGRLTLPELFSRTRSRLDLLFLLRSPSRDSGWPKAATLAPTWEKSGCAGMWGCGRSPFLVLPTSSMWNSPAPLCGILLPTCGYQIKLRGLYALH
jgi:hypothetical protein